MPASGSTDDAGERPLSATGEGASLPEVRRVEPGATLLLCRCGHSPRLPDCPSDCRQGLSLYIERQQLLILCRCGLSRRLPYCDGSHAPAAPSLKDKWRRFWQGD
ncbi:CDGSH iron-sulfur domain-containing protein [Pseudomonas sp. zfem005]|uniref:CDGSH iron-sulfur domain-containing protein n=1 Tax=Pseudomonas sp. zfem005 TaxID=3078200 RepID=UPI0029285E40|nr:CDGSH iron-sulfur domain-containing protein [Pseudomonas sp. zfem005]MDU9412471.1 CDGSH iron-sulfur domain-containing protein [Pseudomonas sp. zfem005]